MKNEGKKDRIVRAIVALVLFLLAVFVLTGILSTIAYVLGAVMLITAAVGFCPLYKLFGIDTTK